MIKNGPLAMRCALLFLMLWLAASGETARYELRGLLKPATHASVWLHGATAPFEESTLADDSGHFRFRDLLAGTYTLGTFVPGRGEIRRTIEVGPSQADARKRIELTVELRDGDFESRDSVRRAAMISAKELAIPEQARREYEEAQKRLAKRDAEGAAERLERAVRIAPQFAAAWNNLGTIAYQTRAFPHAESCFRKALEADPDSYMPLVNLGGVLLNLGKFDEALSYNLYAALNRPNDALANSQLGMNYYYLNRLDLGKKYLTIAKQLDPAHFSHPQLVLADIALRNRDRAAAAVELEEFVQYHPDSPQAGKVKESVAKLRNQPDPAQEFAATGMARSYSESDNTIGSGRHVQVRLNRNENGSLTEAPGGPGFGFSSQCLACHASRKDGHTVAMGCVNCHGATASGKPGQAVCLQCHVDTNGPKSGHGPVAATEDVFLLNSAGYRLLQSRCYQNSAGKLTCTTCHPPHNFSKTAAEFRLVCRGCHPTMHNGAALDCTRCHMPKRPTQDAGQVMVTDHRIQRPL